MATYSYRCQGCGKGFEKTLPMAESKNPQVCPDCGAEAGRILDGGIQFALNGDLWPGKAIKIKNQMAAKNRRLSIKQKDNHAPIKLVPNVEGEQVESWSEARKLAKDRGKDVASYDHLVRREGGGA